MKTVKYFILSLLFIGLFSCKKSSEAVTPQNVGGNLQSGTWHITSLVDGGQDKTNFFQNSNFTFNSDGTVTASGSGAGYTGTWGAQYDDGVSKLILHFSSFGIYSELNDDWKVEESTS